MEYKQSNPPQDLVEMQKWFVELITQPLSVSSSASPLYSKKTIQLLRERVKPGERSSPEECMALYHQKYWKRIFKLLEYAFPTIKSIFGTKAFHDSLAIPFFRTTFKHDVPLESQFLKWLRTQSQSLTNHDLPIFELARVDALYTQLRTAPSYPEILWDQFSLAETEILGLQPCVIPIELEENIFAFRQKVLEQNSCDWEVHSLPKIEKWSNKRFFCIYRNDKGTSHYVEILEAQFHLLTSLKDELKFRDAIDILRSHKNWLSKFENDFCEWLHLWVKLGWLYLKK